MKVNIGIGNALLRITCGFTLLAWATANMVKRPWRDSFLIVAILGAMKVAEGMTRFCPLTALLEKYKETDEKQSRSWTTNPT